MFRDKTFVSSARRSPPNRKRFRDLLLSKLNTAERFLCALNLTLFCFRVILERIRNLAAQVLLSSVFEF